MVGYSGGVDSSLVAVVARQTIGRGRSLAAIGVSASLPQEQYRQAREIADQFDLELVEVPTDELNDPHYTANTEDRCYHCKSELFRQLLPLAAAEGLAHVAYGLIVDDLSDYRPGHRAAAEAGVRAPLADAGLGKQDIRTLSKALDLPTWDLPASPCLSSRLPYGTAVTPEALRRVDRAEAGLRALGFRELRVRHLGEVARVEIAPGEMPRLEAPGARSAAETAVREAGYAEVRIDPEGYRRGRLNEALRIVEVVGDSKTGI